MEENTSSPYTAPQANMNMSGQSDFGPITPLLASSGWLKFLGILAIIAGALYAITLVGLVIAWLPIWIGVLLLQAGGRLNEMNTAEELYEAADKLRLVIKIFGIGMIINIAFVVIWLAFMGSFMGMMMANGGMQ